MSAAPALACDAHIHINDAGSVERYRGVQARIGTQRVVVVAPRAHGTDNRVTVEAVRALGADRARGIAVVHPGVTDAQLQALHAGGVRGLRFSVHEPGAGVTTIGMIEPLSRRIAALGWHAQIHMLADQIVANAAMLGRIPSAIVFDHMARLPAPEGAKHAAFPIVRGLVERGRAWVKLSGPYLNSALGPPAYSDVAPIARAWVAAAPDRLVWGSDWPHPTERGREPDDAVLFAQLAEWVPDDAARAKILGRNAAELYGFN
jgi:predicted TIM-barrel fold metal-dependent hydrolase